MKKLLMMLLAFACLLSAFDAAAASKKSKKSKKAKKSKVEKVNWQSDISKALADAKKNKKQIFLVLDAPTSSKEAQALDKAVFKHKNFIKAVKNHVVVKTDYQKLSKMGKKMPAVWQKYPPVKSGNKDVLPTVYLLDSNGAVLEKSAEFGTRNPGDFIKSFKSYKKK